MQQFSVLLSVYSKEHAEFLRLALDSVFSQTISPTEVVLVEDGPLTNELEAVVMDFEQRQPTLKVVRTPQNQGLGRALNEGLKHCSYELVARMDTDDICKPYRFEKQLAVFQKKPEISVCGSWINEFFTDAEHTVSQRCTPGSTQEIYEYGKKRNPMNHVTVMFRKTNVIKSGGYQDYPLFEDYYLWVRMLVFGYKFFTIQEPLVDVRADVNMIARRGGFYYALTEARIQFLFFGLRYINFRSFLYNLAARFSVRIMPAGIRAKIYKKKLRQHEN